MISSAIQTLSSSDGMRLFVTKLFLDGQPAADYDLMGMLKQIGVFGSKEKAAA